MGRTRRRTERFLSGSGFLCKRCGGSTPYGVKLGRNLYMKAGSSLYQQ